MIFFWKLISIFSDRAILSLSRREICAAHFLPPSKSATKSYQMSELRAALKKGTYCNGILVWGNQLLTT